MLSERQKEIINASFELISEGGIQALTIKNLSKKIGISEPAIYRHYENKMQILCGILESFKIQTANLLGKILNNDDNGFVKIEELFTRLFQIFNENPSIVAVIFSEEIFMNEEILKNKVAGLMKENDNLLQKLIIQAQEVNIMRSDIPASHISTLLMGTVRLLVKRWQLSNYNFNIVEEGMNQLNSLKTILKV